jgi:drug/metabolite transporter (DMT)-like permease
MHRADDHDHEGRAVTAIAITLATLSQFLLVAGQLLLRKGMRSTPVRVRSIIGGIILLSGWFFLWLGLLADWDLSKLFPFEGLNPVLVLLGAWLFLKEHVPLLGWIGIILISLGVGLVTSS